MPTNDYNDEGGWTREWFEEAEESVRNLQASRKTIEELNSQYKLKFRGKNTDGNQRKRNET